MTVITNLLIIYWTPIKEYNIYTPHISNIIVNDLPNINLKNSVKFSFNPIAVELKTIFLFVKYANIIDTIIPIVLAIFPSTLKTFNNIVEIPILTNVVNTPKTIYNIVSFVITLFIISLIF